MYLYSMSLLFILQGNIGSKEYPENSDILVNCSSLVDNIYKLSWQICINDQIYTLCSRFYDQNTCSGTADRFKGRINSVNAGTIQVTKMKKDENGVLQCYKGIESKTIKLQKILIIGNNYDK